MAEHVVKHVRLLEVVELVGAADEAACRKAAVGQMLEEHLIGHQARHRDDLPAGVAHQHVAQAGEVGNLGGADRQLAHAFDERVAGAAGQQTGLALEQRGPDRVFRRRIRCPALINGPVGIARRVQGHACYFNAAWSAKRARSMSRRVSPPASWVVKVILTIL